MTSVGVHVLTNDNHRWCLRPFAYCFNEFWPDQEVTVWGASPPVFPMPKNFRFKSIARYNFPVERWTDSLAIALRDIPQDYFVFLLEDYWLTERVNVDCVHKMVDFIQLPENDQVLRIDLSADRYSKKHVQYATYSGYNVIETLPGTPYQMSYQAAVWNRKLLLEVLKMGETPWQSEVNGSNRLNKRPDLHILGTEVRPIKYVPTVRSRKAGIQNLNRIPQPHRDRVVGMIPRSKR